MKTFNQFFLEQQGKVVTLLPGGFKPPHKGHFEALKYLLKAANQGVVFIGPSIRDGINADQSEKIWGIYKKYLPKPVSVVKSPVTPVKSVYEFVDTNKNNFSRFIVGAGEEDMGRYSYFNKKRDIYPNVDVVAIPPQFGRISGSQTRQLIATDIDKAVESFVPQEISAEDRERIKHILIK